MANLDGPASHTKSVSAIANPPTIIRDVAGIEQDSQRILGLWRAPAPPAAPAALAPALPALAALAPTK
ncbi:hypothetical protein CNYM01_09438 [Colletotrichum nymphaeae SA-01]|uniref:Uncharacterized protein n=1 Tax=Colletotrichum nymphaeae SA-01 TaxID=1460502 RepID=A0A135THI2_9PEZI|nr:hypothetical protein CNYM01_09438 [Colletotrichum nymphaeae SA-01]